MGDHHTITELLLLTYPILLGLGSAFVLVPKKGIQRRCGSVPSIQPPSWIFYIVWPIMYCLIGVAGYVYYKKNGFTGTLVYFIAATLLLIGWWIIFNKICYPKAAFACLVVITAMFLTLYCIFARGESRLASWLTAPLICWLYFACYLVYITIKDTAV
jgi:tryptophan-rich sensory protein